MVIACLDEGSTPSGSTYARHSSSTTRATAGLLLAIPPTINNPTAGYGG